MKQTKIQYSILGTKILIVSIKNIATINEIKKEFGEKVFDNYKKGFPFYISGKNNTIGIFYKEKSFYRIAEKQIYNKEDFQKIISLLKQSGKRLNEIIKSYEIKTIKI